MKDFREFVFEHMVKAKEMLERDGEFPNILIYGPGPKIIFLKDSNRPLWNILARMAAKGSPAVVHITETWYKEVAEDYKGPPPSQMEDREEALIVEAKSRKGDDITLVQKFEHGWDGKIKWIGEVIDRPFDRRMFSRVMDGLYEP